MIRTFDNFTECYISLLDEVYNSCDFVSSPRNQKVKEKLGVAFRIKDPLHRYPFVEGRKFSSTYLAAELLWYLSGDNSTSWISKYSKFWSRISDDGTTANSAYGARLFKTSPVIANSRFSQWEYIKEELSRDPDSRRAVMHIRVPSDSIDAKLDVPCTLSLQFFIRNNELHMITNMRSSDLIFGIAYDIPAFTFFQEMLAVDLGVGIGTYTHVSNSLHIYERHFSMAEEILNNENIKMSLAAAEACGPMKPLNNSSYDQGSRDFWVSKLMNFENELQHQKSIGDIVEVYNRFKDATSVREHVWSDIATLLSAHRIRRISDKSQESLLNPCFHYAGFTFGLGE